MSTIPKEFGPDNNAEIRRVNGRGIFVGRLPDDFLRIPLMNDQSINDVSAEINFQTTQNLSQQQTDHQLACQLQSEFNHERRIGAFIEQYAAQLVMTVIDAKMTKNYGILNMSTYVRFRIGHMILETQTAVRGGKDPKWNQYIRCNFPKGVGTIEIEIYQECLISTDELIANGHFQIPEDALQFSENEHEKIIETVVPLSGKHGQNREGCLTIIFTFRDIRFADLTLPQTTYYPVSHYPNFARRFYPYTSVQPTYAMEMPISYGNQQVIVQQNIDGPLSPVSYSSRQAISTFSENDFKSLQEIFPKIDPDIIRTMLINNNGNVDRTTTSLLELNSTTS